MSSKLMCLLKSQQQKSILGGGRPSPREKNLGGEREEGKMAFVKFN